jgi:hypothetical protein
MQVIGRLHAPAALPRGEVAAVSIEEEAGWTPEPIWTLWRKNLVLPRIRTPAVQPVARGYTDGAIPTPFVMYLMKYCNMLLPFVYIPLNN